VVAIASGVGPVIGAALGLAAAGGEELATGLVGSAAVAVAVAAGLATPVSGSGALPAALAEREAEASKRGEAGDI
jgi:cytochrome c biogenesis protein CcdA